MNINEILKANKRVICIKIIRLIFYYYYLFNKIKIQE